MPKNKSLFRQAKEILSEKLCIGEPKHLDKQAGFANWGIYSWSTYKNYLSSSRRFVNWVKDEHGSGVRTLEQARPHVDAYLRHHIDKGYSPYTQKAIASALAKLYGCSTRDFIPTQPRRRGDITRSRKGRDGKSDDSDIRSDEVKTGKNKFKANASKNGKSKNGKSKSRFSESKNQEFVDFCRATGLRRSSIEKLKGGNIGYDKSIGRHVIVGITGKGGRPIVAPILCDKAVERIKNTPIGQPVWENVPTNADIHSYRADYCKTIYEMYARPIADVPKNERYYCRGDLKGVVYDKQAMAVASRVLGHNRISVIAGHYLHGFERHQQS